LLNFYEIGVWRQCLEALGIALNGLHCSGGFSIHLNEEKGQIEIEDYFSFSSDKAIINWE